jgi:hypothetical protein
VELEMETEEDNEEFAEEFGEEFAEAFAGIGQQEQRFYSHLNDSLRDTESKEQRMCSLHRLD